VNITSLLEAIESYDLAARINIASSLRSAVEILLGNLTVLELRKAVKAPEAAYSVLTRVFELTKRATDLRYENPNDTALFIYEFALNEHHPPLAVIAAGAICQVPNLWWASEFSTEIIDNRTARNSISGETAIEAPFISDAIDRVFITDTRRLFSAGVRLLQFIVSTPFDDADVVMLDMDPVVWTEAAEGTRDLPLAVS